MLTYGSIKNYFDVPENELDPYSFRFAWRIQCPLFWVEICFAIWLVALLRQIKWDVTSVSIIVLASTATCLTLFF
jgi:hypothetical protein